MFPIGADGSLHHDRAALRRVQHAGESRYCNLAIEVFVVDVVHAEKSISVLEALLLSFAPSENASFI